MRTRDSTDETSEPLKGVRDPEREGAGCLVALGFAGLLPLLLVLGVVASVNLRSLGNSVNWTNSSETFSNFWLWIQRGTPHPGVAPLLAVFGLGYGALLWQWIAFRIGRGSLLSPARLWPISSAFFLVAGLTAYLALWQFQMLRASADDLIIATLVTVGSCGIFLCLTIPLWIASASRRAAVRAAHSPTLKKPRSESIWAFFTPKRRPFFVPRGRRGLLTKARRSELDAAGCLVLMGLLLALPIVLFCLVVAVRLGLSLKAGLSSATTILEGWAILGEWSRRIYLEYFVRSGQPSPSLVYPVLITAYLYLFSQWTAFLLNWRLHVRTPKLWIVSAVYIGCAMISIAVATWPDGNPGDLGVTDPNRVGIWLATNLAVVALGGVYLCTTLVLWWISSRKRSRSGVSLDSQEGNS